MEVEGWQQTKVDEMIRRGALALNDGYRVRNVELGPVGIPFVRGGDIGDGGINTAVEDHIRPEFTDRVQSKLTRPFDVAFITKGTVGRVGMVRPGQPQSVFAPQVCYWRSLDTEQIEPRFLFYLLTSTEFQANLDAVKTHGSMAADYVSMTDQRDFRLTFPPIGAQRAIAAVLGALDDKIELNRRMNATLEAMARALFQSWYVDFDPVRAKLDGRQPPGLDPATAALFPATLHDSEAGHIPKGWEVVSLEELASIRGGKQLPTEDCLPVGEFTVFGANGIMGYARQFTHDSFVIAFGRVGAYCGSVHWSLDGAWINNNASAVVPLRWPAFVLQTMLNIDFDSMRTGSAQPFIPNSSLASAKVLRPSPAVAEAFCRIVGPLRRQQADNEKQSRILATLRDALLPKLLSGELSVASVCEERWQ